jgi:hypothetical protein
MDGDIFFSAVKVLFRSRKIFPIQGENVQDSWGSMGLNEY